MGRIAYVNGRYTPHAEAAVHIEDRGYQLADAIDEVWAVFDGEVPAEVSLRSVLAVSYLGIIGSVVGFVAYLYVLQRLQAATVALIPLITPVFALLLGAWLADELVPASTLQGAALVLLGLGCYQYGDRLLARWRLRPA